MNRLVAVCLSFSISLIGLLLADESTIQFYRSTDHYEMYCVDSDQVVADALLEVAEKNFVRISEDFQYCPSQKICLKIYPSIEDFHFAIGWPEAPGWAVGSYNIQEHAVQMVSPNHPGPVHNAQSLMHTLVHQITKSFIYDRYGTSLPVWLVIGASMHEAKQSFLVTDRLKALSRDHSKIYPIEEWEQIPFCEFAKKNGFALSYAWVEWIQQEWGWAKVLELLKDYSIEKILGISKSEADQRFIHFVDQKYGFQG
jgi:hypothetical protein